MTVLSGLGATTTSLALKDNSIERDTLLPRFVPCSSRKKGWRCEICRSRKKSHKVLLQSSSQGIDTAEVDEAPMKHNSTGNSERCCCFCYCDCSERMQVCYIKFTTTAATITRIEETTATRAACGNCHLLAPPTTTGCYHVATQPTASVLSPHTIVAIIIIVVLQQILICNGAVILAHRPLVEPASALNFINNKASFVNVTHVDSNDSLLESLSSIVGETTGDTSLNDDFVADAKAEASSSMTQVPIFDFGVPRNITGRTGQAEALIKCRVDNLRDKSVSWIRKRDLHILTVGNATYTSDKRFEVTESRDAREWTLHVKTPQPRDGGIYECQVNTEPKMCMAFQLNIIEISPDSRAVITGPRDLHFKAGSVIILNCLVQQAAGVRNIGPIYWYRGERMISPFDMDEKSAASRTTIPAATVAITGVVVYSEQETGALHQLLANDITPEFVTRIAMESQLGDTLKSRLRIVNAQTVDTGNYTCQPTTASSASVMVHVINDQKPAAMQKSGAVAPYSSVLVWLLVGIYALPVVLHTRMLSKVMAEAKSAMSSGIALLRHPIAIDMIAHIKHFRRSGDIRNVNSHHQHHTIDCSANGRGAWL